MCSPASLTMLDSVIALEVYAESDYVQHQSFNLHIAQLKRPII